MLRYIVSHHRGHSGRSVFEWRVYRLLDANGNGSRIIKTQLGKFRTQEAAEAFRAKLAARA